MGWEEELDEAKGNPADDAIEGATEAEDKRVAVIIAILALFLALAESAPGRPSTSRRKRTSKRPTCSISTRPRNYARRSPKPPRKPWKPLRLQ